MADKPEQRWLIEPTHEERVREAVSSTLRAPADRSNATSLQPGHRNKHRGGRTKRSVDVGPLLRHNTLRALGLLLKDARQEPGKEHYEMAHIIRDAIQEGGLGNWINIIAKYRIREVDVAGEVYMRHEVTGRVRHTHEELSETSSWVADVLGDDEDQPVTESVSH